MNIMYRIALAFSAIVLAVYSIVWMMFILNPEMTKAIFNLILTKILEGRNFPILIFTLNLVVFFSSIIFLFSGIKSDKDKKAICKLTDLGELKVSLVSIENIALGVTKKISGVRDVKASVKKSQDNVYIAIKTIVMPDVIIPELLEEIQNRVKKVVESITGIKVLRINAMVDNISTVYKSRVE